MIVDLWIAQNKHYDVLRGTLVTLIDADLPRITYHRSTELGCGYGRGRIQQESWPIACVVHPMHVNLRSRCIGYRYHNVHEEVL